MQHTHARAVLWDMDGTLLDSGEYHWLAWRDTMEKEGHPITHEQFVATFGQRNETIIRTYLGEDVSMDDIERIADVKEVSYRDLVRSRGVQLLPGVHYWLDRLRQDAWQQAVASSAPRLNIETILETLNIGHYFQAVVCSEDVERGKPDPQVFQTAAARVGVAPQHCIVVEDAPAGVEAARRAGMHSIGVCSSHATLQADMVVHSLDELPADAFEQFLR